MSGSRRLELRRPDRCAACGCALARGSVAFWDAEARTVTCLDCREPARADAGGTMPVLDRGVAGASARRRYEQLRTARERRVRAKLGRLGGGVYLAVADEPQSTAAWERGSRGERLLADHLDKARDDDVFVVLHDRRIPGSRANIDHIAVTRSGVVWAIDAKRYRGKKVERIDRGGWFSQDLRLSVGGRDCTKLVDGTAKQVDATRAALGEAVVLEFGVEVRAALCFVDADWALFAKPFDLDGVWIGRPKALVAELRREGELGPADLRLLATSVAAALPPA